MSQTDKINILWHEHLHSWLRFDLRDRGVLHLPWDVPLSVSLLSCPLMWKCHSWRCPDSLLLYSCAERNNFHTDDCFTRGCPLVCHWLLCNGQPQLVVCYVKTEPSLISLHWTFFQCLLYDFHLLYDYIKRDIYMKHTHVQIFWSFMNIQSTCTCILDGWFCSFSCFFLTKWRKTEPALHWAFIPFHHLGLHPVHVCPVWAFMRQLMTA